MSPVTESPTFGEDKRQSVIRKVYLTYINDGERVNTLLDILVCSPCKTPLGQPQSTRSFNILYSLSQLRYGEFRYRSSLYECAHFIYSCSHAVGVWRAVSVDFLPAESFLISLLPKLQVSTRASRLPLFFWVLQVPD